MFGSNLLSARKKTPIQELGNSFTPSPSVLMDAEEKLSAIFAETDDEKTSLAGYEKPVSIRERRDISKILRVFIYTDLAAFACGFVCALSVAVLVNSLFLGRELKNFFVEDDGYRLAQIFVTMFGVGLWFEHKGHYRVRMPFWLETKKIVGTVTFAMVVDGFLQFATKQDFSRLWLVSSWAFTGFFIVLFRYAIRSRYIKSGKWQVPTLLIGGGETAADAMAALKSEPSLGYEVVSKVRDLPQELSKHEGSWEAMCAAHCADYVVLALEGGELPVCESEIAQLMRENVPFSVSPPLRHLPVLGMTPHYFFNHDIMLLTRNSGLEQPLPQLIKRTFDIAVSAAALVALSPLFLLIAGLIKLEGGRVFFPNRRVGFGGREFDCLKFRSMVENSDEVLKEYLASADKKVVEEWRSHKKLRGEDPRVTRAGRLLRELSFDELPQLINVLKGEMSLVGPRPILPRELKEYGKDIALYTRLRPGITGLWQVSGRNEVTYAERVEMDCWYIRNWSLWHDVAILCKTVPVLLNRKGAY